MSVTVNFNWPRPNPLGIQIEEITRIDQAVVAADEQAKLQGDGLSALVQAFNTHQHSFASLTGRPTTLAGYGIGDGQSTAEKNKANGYAGLDAGGKLPMALMPATMLGAVIFQGLWNAATNTPTIPPASAENKGWYFMVNTAGTTSIDGEADWNPSDWIISDGTRWRKVDNTDQVTSVAGKRGDVTLVIGDIENLQTALDATVAISRGGTGGTTQAAARTNLGLGAAAQLGVPIPVASGGTGGITQAAARTGLGLGDAATRNITVSTANPSGGANGDIWLKV